jgi:GR25 family glycosyltransferase involved in LPS biosynthesis
MIKIAYIFFGQVKNFNEKQFWALENNVLKQIKGLDLDFFLTTSKNTKFVNPRQKSTEGEPQDINYRSIDNFFDFKNTYYDNESDYPEKDIIDLSLKLLAKGGSWKEGDELKSISNSIKQIYGLEYFYNNFKNQLDNYDYFILSRSDLFHTHPINLQFLTEDKDLWTPRYNIFPQIDYGNFGGLNDRFAIIKNPEALKSYCTRYSSIKRAPQKYHAEKYLKQQIESGSFNKGVIDDFIFEFVRSNGEISDIIGIEADPNMNRALKNIDKTFVINLDRRVDRLNHFLQNSPIFANRYSAIDANSLKLTSQVKKLFKKSLTKITKAEIACSLSHYNLWRQLVEDNSSQNYLILEDDVVFEPGFESFWNNVFAKNLPTDYNLIYLGGCQPWNRPLYTKVLQRHNDYFYNIKKNDFFTKDDHYWHMNAQSYIISKKGASLMCQYLDQFGFDLEKNQAQDIFMGKFFSNNKIFSDPNSVYHLYPPMTRQIHEEDDNTEIDKKSDLRFAKEKFDSDERISFPRLAPISKKEIPKKIHLSWKDKNILSSSFKMIKKGAKNLETLNPEWDIEVSDDEDVNKYIRDNIGKSSWELIKDKKITEKTDLWRLLKVYKEGGMYIDIDRYIDTPISEIISENTECVIPTFQNIDFSQDFILSIQKNPMLERAISHNLFNRKSGKDLFYVAVHSYMHAVSEFLDGKMTDRGVNEDFFNKIRKQLSEDPKFSTYKETGPSNHILFRNLEKKFSLETYEQDKADFYNNQSVEHWNHETEKKHKALKTSNNNCLVFLNKNLFEEDFILHLFDKPEVIYNEGLDLIKPGATYVYSNATSTEHVWKYPKSVAKKIFNYQNCLRSFFDKLKGKNCNLIHLSDEHCHAEIDYYKNFNHVFRQYYREDAEADNVTFIPLGYKSGFIDE